jgi:GDPmannose 4,6-dehydratase
MKTAVITGVTGQDGAYLSELLLKKNYKIIGLTRSYNTANFDKLEYLGIKDNIIFEECDLTDISSIIKIYTEYNPDEVYNLGSQSSVGLSFNQPMGTVHYNIISVMNLLESIKILNKNIKFYQASSSEMYGLVSQLPVTELTPVHPVSPYAISKASAHWIVVNYRESYKLFACSGILFNHESYLRSHNFFIKKIISDAVKMKNGKLKSITVGNLDVKRDFGFAPYYVNAMWLMLQNAKPADYIICSGKSLSLREILVYIFSKLDLNIDNVQVDPKLYRPAEICDIYGDDSKARNVLGWNYNMTFYDVLDLIIEEEIRNN